MARAIDNSVAKNADQSDNVTTFQAHGNEKIDLSNADFVADAQMSREGDNLILQTPDGETAVIEGYFSADPAPVLHAPDGSVLTPNLVQAFLQSPMQYAAGDTASDESPVGAVEEVKGYATVTRADGTVETITNGTPIYKGDVVQTDAEGAVNIVFLDETSMAVSSNARLAIDDYSYDPSTESGTTNFSVLRGLFVFTSGLIGRDDPDDVKIETPVGSIGIRGTIIAGEIVPGGQSNISVLEGAIVVKNGVGEITLSQQFETVRLGGFDQPMQGVSILPAAEIGTRFGSISNVNASLFSTINDAAQEQSTPLQSAPTFETPQSDTAPEKAPVSSLPSPDALAPIDSSLPSLNTSGGTGLPSNEVVTGQTSSGLGITQSSTVSTTATTNTVVTAPLAVTVTQDTSQALPSTPTTLQPPPSVINNVSGTGTNGGTSSTRPAWADIDLNTVSAATAASHRLITDNIDNGFGFNIAALGDRNNDGFDDFIVGKTSDAAGQNHVYVFNGGIAGIANTSPIGTTIGLNTNPASFDDTHVAGIGDFNGDGVEDFAAGQAFNGPFGAGQVTTYNTGINNATATTIRLFDGVAAGDEFGADVSGIADFNNDGFADIVIGAPGENKAYITYGTASTPTSQDFSGTGSTDRLGESVSGIGDFNGDGFSDFIVGAPGGDFARVYLGNNNPLVTPPTVLTINGATGSGFGQEVQDLGDINGDGLSDLFIGGTNSGGIYFGSTSPNADIDMNIAVPSGYNIIGGGKVGDFNGDGYADFSLALGNSTGSETYVVFGKSSAGGAIDYNYLQNHENAIRMNYSGATLSDDLEVSSIGDVNGDGFDDIGMGVPDANGAITGNGGMFVVYGRETGNVQHGGAATANGVSVIGDAFGNTGLSDGGFSGVSLRGGAGADTLAINNTNFLGLHGGGNLDTMSVAGNLDFSDVNFEHISGMEQLLFDGAPNQTITLTMENLFNLLKTSDSGVFQISSSAAGNTLNLFTAYGPDSASDVDATQIESALNTYGTNAMERANTVLGSDTYETFEIGGYTLLIDQDIAVNIT